MFQPVAYEGSGLHTSMGNISDGGGLNVPRDQLYGIAEFNGLNKSQFFSVDPDGAAFPQAWPLFRHKEIHDLFFAIGVAGRRIDNKVSRRDVISIKLTVSLGGNAVIGKDRKRHGDCKNDDGYSFHDVI